MKKQLLTLSSLLLLGQAVNSQITVNSSNFVSVGDRVIMTRDSSTTMAVVASGTNLTFNFASINDQDVDTIDFIDPSTTPYASDFPSSNLALDYNDGSYAFTSSTSSAVELVGGLEMGIPVRATNPQTMVNFPTNYGDYYMDTYEIKGQTDGASVGAPVDSVRLTVTGTKYSEVDAWGDLTTPLGTFPVLRFNDTVYETTEVEAKSGGFWIPYLSETDTTYSHVYISDNISSKYILLSYDYDPATGQISDDIDWAKVTPSAASITENDIDFDIYPNPVNNKLSIATNEKVDELIVTNIVGKTVLSNQNQNNINVQSLVKGNYFITVKSGTKVATQKFVKQ